MDVLQENYKKGLEHFINLQEVLIEEIRVDIERCNEDVRLAELKKKLNIVRLETEEIQLKAAKETLKNIEIEEE